MKNRMKKKYIPVYIVAVTVWLLFYTCTGISAGRELQTIYSVGNYRTKSVGGLGNAIRNTRKVLIPMRPADNDM
jgi:hypothetical protein